MSWREAHSARHPSRVPAATFTDHDLIVTLVALVIAFPLVWLALYVGISNRRR